MRQTQITKVIAMLELLKEEAEEKADNSESEKTIDKYEGIGQAIDEAIDALQGAIDEFFS